MGAIFWQVHEMIKVYDPISEQAKAAVEQAKSSEKSLISAQRAWVGPRSAKLSAEPAIGKPLEITIDYQNSGRDPALDVIWTLQPLLSTAADDSNGTLGKQIAQYMQACKSTSQWAGGNVVYPTTSGFGGSGYILFTKSNPNVVDESLVKGDKILIVQGCFLYRSFDVPRHSYFCYFWQKDRSKFDNLNICIQGHYAD